MILLIDNYDSFTYNLYQMLGEIVPDIEVRRSDEITIAEIETMQPDAIVLSPGPGYPAQAGISEEAVRTFSGKIPILGICLGHQAIAEAFGGRIVPAEHLMHGRASRIKVDESHPLFKGQNCAFQAGRYHSLIVEEESLPDCLYVIALDENGQIMGISHKTHKTYGLQFHPESVLTKDGAKLLRNFLVDAGLTEPEAQMPSADLKPYYQKVLGRESLTMDEAEKAMEIIMSGHAQPLQIAALLTSLAGKGETIEEIAGLAKGMRAKASYVPDCQDSIDIVGTGGDRAASFNISTTSAFVAAAAGARVAKHGNRSVSSKSGAADVLEALGCVIASRPEQAKHCLQETGVSFLFAQSYHASMRFVGPVRGVLGVRTVFNLLGPLTNPAAARDIVMGVYSRELTDVMAKVLREIGIRRAMVVYGMDCLDEISVSAETAVAEVRDGEIRNYEICPEDFGMPRYQKSEIVGGTPQENAVITRGILEGKITGAKRDIVLLNAGAALYTYGIAETLADGVKLAAEQIDSGRALEKLEEFIRVTNEMR